ncbi:DUF5590 domain-containing protein [Jeotgalibacillus soli]|uniref:Cell wall elongation regulator TseB-like domain-containing protein n=1 Tax=Jeotgalibacillus soli TaxID=889306 RepID=A0A0C2V581_9BACL|nr:DUF5590 domain-containing protein [Jeotgalibacillus soli]KIL44172.1 hypothetical protein KP78_31360 [Jeotgalibacillus soli]
MKKWIVIILSLLTVVVITLFISIYVIARQPLTSSIEEAVVVAQNDLEMQSIDDQYIYNGTNSYVVVTGISRDTEQIVAWIPRDEGEIVTRQLEDGITQDEVFAMLEQEDSLSKVTSIKLGYESVGPVWEIKYEDQDANLNYYYVLFDTGEWWRTINNL